MKKGSKRLYHLRCLRKLSVDTRIMSLVYNSLISSVLLYAVTVWFESCGIQLRDEIWKIRRRSQRIIGPSDTELIDPFVTHRARCISLAKKIVRDEKHPLHKYFKLLPHGVRYQTPKCRTTRFQNTFLPTSVGLLNSS